MTWISLDLKSYSREVYTMSKVLESWMVASYTGDLSNSTEESYSFQEASFD